MSILQNLSEIFSQKSSQIENFFEEKNKKFPPLFYNSVDLRHCGFKIAPIDTNCFPAGFNNLSVNSRQNAQKIINNFFSKNGKNKIIILAESHTRNLRYLENLLALQEIIQSDQREVLLGSLADIDGKLEVPLGNDQTIIIHKLIRKGDKVITESGFEADIIISNNDFTGGVDNLLYDITQHIIPSPSFGWHSRTKSIHFKKYDELVSEFCKIIDIDPWLISAHHLNYDDVNFKEGKGMEILAGHVDEVIEKISTKYEQYGIKEKPYCYVKADSGTHGMAIFIVSSGSEVRDINKKNRNKMNMLKGRTQNTKVIIQEGIITIDKVKNMISEPLIYLINGQVVGNLFRVNDSRNINNSLNSAGMSFYDLANLENSDLSLDISREELQRIYSIISRLAALAASSENM